MTQAVVTARPRRRSRGPAASREHGARPPTRVSANSKLAIWLFLSSEGTLLRGRSSRRTSSTPRGRDAQFLKKGPPPPTSCSTSRFTFGHVVRVVDELAQRWCSRFARESNAAIHRRLRIWLLATCLFGATFRGRAKVYEFTEFYRQGLHLGTNMFGTTFLRAPPAFHGAHHVHHRHHLAALGLAPVRYRAAYRRRGRRPSRSPVASTGTFGRRGGGIFIFTADLSDPDALRTLA